MMDAELYEPSGCVNWNNWDGIWFSLCHTHTVIIRGIGLHTKWLIIGPGVHTQGEVVPFTPLCLGPLKATESLHIRFDF